MSIPDGERRARIAHLTSVHARTDSRVFNKQCRSLAKARYDVTLVVADGLGDAEFEHGLQVVDVGRPTGRLRRMVTTTRRVFSRAIELDADLYQLHDPELLPIGLWLKRRGKKVIFDSHEDVPKQILGKAYLPMPLLRLIAGIFAPFEAWAVGKFDAVIGATPSITAKFRPLAQRVANVNNFPLLDELRPEGDRGGQKRPQVCYVGGISEARGILTLVDALSKTDSHARLELAGTFSEAAVRATAHAMPGWPLVDERGYCNRTEVADILARSIAGVVVLAPVPNHVESLPVKMFEYMSAGLPVIASNFEMWLEIIEGTECGLCVDPFDSEAVASAIDRLVKDPVLAERMGRNGRKAAEERYNWTAEEPALFSLYQAVLEQGGCGLSPQPES